MERVLPHVPTEALPDLSLVKTRIELAKAKLRFDLRLELLHLGHVATGSEIDRMVAAIPAGDVSRLIAART